MTNSKLYFLIGSARSGKSTFSKKWQSEKEMRVVVSGDNIRLATHGTRYNKLAEDSVFCTLHIMVRTLLLSGYEVLIDETNTSEMSIRRILEIDKNATPVFINTPLDICIKRAIDSRQFDVINSIYRHHSNINSILIKYGTIEKFIENINNKIEQYNKFFEGTINEYN